MLKQNDFAYGRANQPVGYSSGLVCAAILTYDFPVDFTSADDVLEIGFVPGGAQIVGATLIGEGLGAITADIGVLDGEAGSTDSGRALTTDLIFDGVSVNDNEAPATVLDCLAVGRTNDHRGLGVTLSGNVTVGSGKKLTVVLHYVH